MNTVEVQELQDRDRSALVAILEASNDFPHQLLPLYRRSGGRYKTFVAWRANEIVGALSGSFDSDFHESRAFDAFDLTPAPHAFLDRVHVHETARGTGAGRALVAGYVAEADARGCGFIGGQIDLSSDATARRAFFERLGFAIRDHDNFGARPEQILRPTI